jgi:phosphoglycerate dehydrogenase-like enzyme
VNKLLILSAEAEEYTTFIQAAALPQLEVRTARDISSAESMVADCNIIFGDPQLVSGVLGSAQKLKWVQSSWAGVDGLCRSGARNDYILTGVKDIFGALISEYVITYLFAYERRVFTMHENQQKRRWQPLLYRPAEEITLGIVGLGSIGRRLARSARHFGIRVIGLNRSGEPCDDVDRVYTRQDLEGFLEAPDYVVLTLPGTQQTRHFINTDVLTMMKPSAVLMNVGRGSLINEHDLVKALKDGVIAGAVLDVFENEPLAQDHPLWHTPNVHITPHTAALGFPADVAAIFIENYRRFSQQEPLLHVVDFDLGY